MFYNSDKGEFHKVKEIMSSTNTLLILLTPKSDEHLISPYNITPESNIKVMRMKEMITN